MLKVSHLSGFNDRRRFTPVTLTYQGIASSSAAASSYTFSALQFGTPRSDREIIVVATTNQTATSTTIDRWATSCTIGGIAATLHVQADHANNNGYGFVAIFSANVPSGSTGNVVVTTNGSVGGLAVYVYDMTGHRSRTPMDIGSDEISDSMATTINPVHYGSCIIAGACNRDNNGFTWSNVTERSDVAFETGRISTASTSQLAAAASRVVGVTTTSTGNTRCLAVAAWR